MTSTTSLADNHARDTAATSRCEGLNALRLVLDIDRSADGRVEGFVHAVGAQAAMPFSGLLELLGALEELLLPDEGAPRADEAAGRENLAGH